MHLLSNLDLHNLYAILAIEQQSQTSLRSVNASFTEGIKMGFLPSSGSGRFLMCVEECRRRDGFDKDRLGGLEINCVTYGFSSTM